jgi:hypothetical protein
LTGKVCFGAKVFDLALKGGQGNLHPYAGGSKKEDGDFAHGGAVAGLFFANLENNFWGGA